MSAAGSHVTEGLEDAIKAAADPMAAAMAISRILEARPDATRAALADDPGLVHTLATVAAASPDLARLCVVDPDAIDVLRHLDTRPPESAPETGYGLLRWKQLELLRIAARDLCGLDPLETVGAALADLADDVVKGAMRTVAGTGEPSMAVIAMGKLGARELNYASDIDLLVVGHGNPRPWLEIVRQAWRVDLNLRPEGRDGPAVRSLASYRVYWDRWAQTWEFQALLKARAISGAPALGSQFIESAAARVWHRPLGADELRHVRAVKSRAETQILRRGLAHREVKLGRGGIRDIEFAVQLLQLVHGRGDQSLRSPATLAALEALASGGYVAGDDADGLAAAYRFLRTVEHRLQLYQGQQVHVVPLQPAGRARLARALGYRDGTVTAAAAFEGDLRRHQSAVRSIHERLFFRPLLEAFTGDRSAPGLTAVAVSDRLAAFGFSDAARTRQAVEALTAGLTRSSRLMRQLLPVLLGWLSDGPDPDLGLFGLRSLAEGAHRRDRLMTVCRESPEAARQLCLLLATSIVFGQGLRRQPDLIGGFADGSALAAHRPEELTAWARQAVAWRGAGDRQAGLARFQKAESLRIASRDVLGVSAEGETGRSLTGLAEAVLQAAFEVVDPQVPFAVVALGRLGGREMAYGSDLDLLLVYQSRAPSAAVDAAAAAAAATAFVRLIGGETPARRIWTIDTTLRPEGRQGVLARSLESYRAYYDRWAKVWERQALLRARPVAGDADVGRRFAALASEVVWGTPLTDDDVRAIRSTKARIEGVRLPINEDRRFHLKLGRGSLSDIEWTAQLSQLRHGVAAVGTIEALTALSDGGFLERSDARILVDAYRFCSRTRDRLHLITGGGADALPATGGTLTTLARSLGTTPSSLRDEYRRLTRRSRRVMERVFYGLDDPAGVP